MAHNLLHKLLLFFRPQCFKLRKQSCCNGTHERKIPNRGQNVSTEWGRIPACETVFQKEKETGRKRPLRRYSVGSTIGDESTMSKLKFNCAHCGQRLECDDAYSGRQITCPKCKATTVVPGVAGEATPSPQKSGMTYVPEDWRRPPPAAGQ
jgi:hypothetical protein